MGTIGEPQQQEDQMLPKKTSERGFQLWNNILWTDETKNNWSQNDGKRRVWRRGGAAPHPEHSTSSVQPGGGSVMAWACMELGPLYLSMMSPLAEAGG